MDKQHIFTNIKTVRGIEYFKYRGLLVKALLTLNK